MTNTRWSMSAKDLTEHMNYSKEIFLEQMKNEGLITKEQVDQMNKYCLLIAEKSFLGKIWDKILWKEDPEAANIIVIKVVG